MKKVQHIIDLNISTHLSLAQALINLGNKTISETNCNNCEIYQVIPRTPYVAGSDSFTVIFNLSYDK